MIGVGSRDGHVELDRVVESIQVGRRHRRDLGDLDELAASIRQLGMLQPITISPDGTLICGARRLAAAKRLGLRRVNVWVRSGISTPLQQLLAEQHDNTMRKPFTPTEAAALYRELKALITEDCARRQEATRFGANLEDGAADSAAPSERRSRAQAAQLVTGRKSYTMLEQVNELQRLAADPATSEGLRELVAAELADIDTDGKVHSHYQRVKHAQAAGVDGAGRDEELAALARQALARVQADAPQPPARRKAAPGGPGGPGGPARRYGVRAFVLTWTDLSGWADHYDPDQIGPALTGDQWADFDATVAATVAFADAARRARTT